MARYAATVAALAVTACLDSPTPGAGEGGDAGGDPDDAAAPRSDADPCEVPAGLCDPAAGYTDSFDAVEGWTTSGADCVVTSGDGIALTRTGVDHCLAVPPTQVDLRCSSLHLTFDAARSSGADAAFSVITDANVYHYIERAPPQIFIGTCDGGDCTVHESLQFDAEEHTVWRLRATADELFAEVAGSGPGASWTPFGTFDGADLGSLDCVRIELGNYRQGASPSTARFHDLNL